MGTFSAVETCDVVVAGAGIAGCVAAASLARAGARVVCLDSKEVPPFKVGESLPADARSLLESAGLVAALEGVPSLRAVGSTSLWGGIHSETLAIQRPYGLSDVIDRSRFEAALRERTWSAGVDLRIKDKVLDLTFRGSWAELLVAGGEDRRLRSRWVIDCTGRRALMAHKCGAVRRIQDRLTAVWCLYSGATAGPDARIVVESVGDGWFYSVPLPGGERIVALFTDSDLPFFQEVKTDEGWRRAVEGTKLIRTALGADGQPLRGQRGICLANSSRLNRIFGMSWVAAGDAALAFDPLSSQGMTSAIVSGINAALAINEEESGNAKALIEYERWVESVFAEYRRQFVKYYTLVPEDYGGEFWRRRSSKRVEASST